MDVQYNDLVRISKEAQFLVGHLHCAMVYVSQIFDHRAKLLGAVLYLGVGDVDLLQLVYFLAQFLLLCLEIFHSVCQVRSLDLLALVILDFHGRLGHILSTKGNQALVLLKVLHLLVDSGLLQFDRV